MWVAIVCATPGAAQVPVPGTVLDSGTAAPLEGALVSARHAARAAVTDRLGRFVVWVTGFPDTLTVAYLGRSPARLVLDSAPVHPLVIRLSTRPVALAEVIVTAPESVARPLEDLGRWQVPLVTARTLPAAVETDVFRSLSLVPAVTFSSPLSARPLIRGYDADESSTRIDGFEVLNLYHIGRVFSAFPADAARQVDVTEAPHDAGTGGALAGTVDITGQTGDPGAIRGGADLSLISATAWGGGGGPGARWFGAARAVHLALANAATGDRFPYDFQDVYANALLSQGGRPAAKITAFGSRDHLFDRDHGSGMDWSNVLLGGRWEAVDDGRRTLSFWASGNRFAEDVADLPARFSVISVRNRFERVAGGLDAKVQSARSQAAVGVSLARRSIANRVTPVRGTDFTPTDASFHLNELGVYGEGTTTIGRASVHAGARLDAAGATTVIQPEIRMGLPLGAGLSLSAGAGLAARLFQLVSDPQSEPSLTFYDFWLNAGRDGVPVPVVDHSTLDLDLTRGAFAGRLSLFGSRARGMAELRPSTDQRADTSSVFRYGRGRTAGMELQIGVRGGDGRRAISATYVLSVSQRDWGAGWIPWSQDRRHLFRLVALTRLGTRWSVSATFEALSGPPVTPIAGIIFRASPDTGGGGLARPGYGAAYVFGPENQARSSGTFRTDLGLRYAFSGPWNSRMTIGLSVINAGFGPVSPLRPGPIQTDGNGRVAASYERLYDMPAVPTISFRAEF
ncbi:MAG TPA: TonB-dependent receptor [Gemmatimonadales bacterium]|nr:TonB-dependent receptor [Gemmatimonadales bacterium]